MNKKYLEKMQTFSQKLSIINMLVFKDVIDLYINICKKFIYNF